MGQALAIFTELDDDHGIMFVIGECAIVCSAEGRAEHALRAYAAAVGLVSRPGVRRRPPTLWRETGERLDAAVRTSSGEAAVAAAWKEGRAMSPEDVMVSLEGAVTGEAKPRDRSATFCRQH